VYHLLIEPFGLPFMRRALLEALLLAVLGGVVSVFVVLRKLAFVSDALTHTVFPGVVVGYLVAGTGGIIWGALVLAALSAVLLTAITSSTRVTEDAALAILLTGFFSVGVVLVSRRASFTADLTAFLFGRILTVDRATIVQTGLVTVLVLGTLALVGKELLLRAFDPTAAAALGYRVPVLDLVLNAAVALVVVAAVRAVGTVLVIALLIVPAATARLLSDRLRVIVPASVAVAAFAGWIGLSASFSASVDHGVRLAAGATVVLVLVGCYLLAVLATAVRRRLPRPSTVEVSG
jgi:manganese/iron transport system permease protein